MVCTAWSVCTAVYARDLKWIPLSERQKQKFADDPPVPVHPDILITKLRPGQVRDNRFDILHLWLHLFFISSSNSSEPARLEDSDAVIVEVVLCGVLTLGASLDFEAFLPSPLCTSTCTCI